jgi:uncharacterized membrane protein (UPF0127 family)
MAALYELRDVESGSIVAARVRAAHTHWTRLRGLLGTGDLASDAGLWLRPCRQVHMIGMRYAIDVLFLDDALRVVHAVAALPPGAVSPKVAAASGVVELAAGTIGRAGLTVGARLAFEPAVVSTADAAVRPRARLLAFRR